MHALTWTVVMGMTAGICWLFPPFRVVPLKQAVAEKAASEFSPTRFAESFWQDRLLPACGTAAPADRLLQGIRNDPSAAKKVFARGEGLGSGYFYFLSGTGRVLSVSDEEVVLNVTGGTDAEVALQTGFLFGNALRDGTGLLDVSDYPDSQDFNGIAEALNHIVETRIQPALREQAKPGSTLSFTGCVEVADESTDLKPLKVIPIRTNEK